MKKILSVALIVCLLVAFAVPTMAAKPVKEEYVSIQDGILLYASGHYLEGETLKTGYDVFGYNYQGHMFKGSYTNSYLGGDGYAPYEGDIETYLEENPGAASHWAIPYVDITLLMKWNDAWISNRDYDGDGKLDRYYGYNSYIGSGAWLTNHQSGTYLDENDKLQHWSYFCKIVAAPADAVNIGGVWYAANGDEIGPVIWGAFAVIQEVETDTGTGENGLVYKAKRPGLGNW